MWNIVKIFVENKSGKFAKVINVLANNNIDILLMDIADDGQFGIMNILTDCPEKTRNILYNENFTVALGKVALIEIEDKPGGLVEFSNVLSEENISISHASGCIIEKGKRALVVIHVENPEALEEKLASRGIKVVASL